VKRVDSVYRDEKQIPGAVLEELKKLNNYLKLIQKDINAIKTVADTQGLKVHVSFPPQQSKGSQKRLRK
jgi:hypothetical protein